MNEYVCKHCGKDLSTRKNKVKICATCSYKNRYFGGLYWEVVKRDNYSCVECGKNGFGKVRCVNVHHKNHDHNDNRVENLEVLCILCHSKKRRAFCKDCEVEFTASNPRQARCVECGIKNKRFMSWGNQAKFWKGKSEARHRWYVEKMKDPAYLRYPRSQ